MEKSILKLVCVDYPGVVKNQERMIETLGGYSSITEAINDGRNKLQLWFRPDDRMSKPMTAVRSQKNSFLIKVRIKRKEKKMVSWELVGHATMEFTFGSLCDFQYIGMDKGVNVYNKLLPNSLDPDWFKDDGPCVLLPGSFTRAESIQGYYFAPKKTDTSADNTELIASFRPKRFGLAIFVGFDETKLPTGPKQKPDPLRQAELDILSNVLAKRPIVSRYAMSGLSGLSEMTLKDLMPFLSYHFYGGPWRALWVKFGYDPRTDPAARIYQTLDFRVKQQDQDELLTMNYVWPKARSRLRKKKPDGVLHDLYIVKPGRVPLTKQCFYQFCDIHLEEVKALLASAEVRAECHPTDGWYPEGTKFACRRITQKYVMEALAQCRTIDPTTSTLDGEPSSGDNSNDSDDGGQEVDYFD